MKKLGFVASLLMVILTTSCVQKEFDKKITFKVDTNGIENVKSIGIRGNFLPNQWRETVFLSDDNKDGVYEISFNEKTAAYNISFKFVKNDKEYELRGEDNRELIFEYQPETIDYSTKFGESTSEIIKN